MAITLLGALSTVPVAAAALALPEIETTITAGPAEGAAIEEERVSFSFAATLAGAPLPAATFRCSVDNAPSQPCASPFQTDQLEDGAHSFSVFAEDAEHFLADPTPARRAFSVVSAEDECELFEDEDGIEEENEDCEEEEAADSSVPPEECLLRTARARLFTFSAQNRIRLIIRYTAFAGADAFVDYRLSGARGPLKLGGIHQRLSEGGMLRIGQRLSDGEMDRVRAAKRFTVSIAVPETPQYCRRYETRHLTIRRTAHGQVVWFQSDSIFGG